MSYAANYLVCNWQPVITSLSITAAMQSSFNADFPALVPVTFPAAERRKENAKFGEAAQYFNYPSPGGNISGWIAGTCRAYSRLHYTHVCAHVYSSP